VKKIKVLFIENCDYVSFPIGGQHSFIRALLANMTVDVYLVGIATQGESVLQWITKDIVGRQRPFFALEQVDPSGKTSSVPGRFHQLLKLMQTKKKLLECKPDVIFTQSPEAVFPFLVGYNQIPSVFGLAGANNPLSHSRFRWARLSLFQMLYEKILLKTAISRATSVLAINDDCVNLCTRLRGKHTPNWEKIPVAVNREIFYPLDRKMARKKIGIESDCAVIICVGRLAKVKGLDMAFQILQKMLKTRDSRLLLVGDGEDRVLLEDDARRNGLTEKIIFCGAVSHDKLPWLLNASDVFFMPSLAEGLPVAMLEAMSCGLPVVASAVGGIPEVIIDGVNGFLLPDRNIDTVFDVLTRALEITDEFRERVIHTVEAEFSIKFIASKIEQLFIAAAPKRSTQD